MKNCRNLLIGTHGDFGKELVKSAEMIIGKMEGVYVFSLLPGMSLADYVQEIQPVLDGLEEPCLCLVDLFGGTPSNTFAALSAKYDIQVVTGLNLAMLIEAYTGLGTMTAEQLKEAAAAAFRESCKDIAAEMKHSEKSG